jgi:arylsulfatase A-like enzyme
VFLSADTLAAANLSLYGYPRRTTPNLERLAGEALVFDDCLANAPFTAPSYVSQFTGLSPRSSWIDPRAALEAGSTPERWQVWHVPPERTTLAEVFREAGYRTAAFVDNVMAGPEFGLDQGFEVYDTAAAKIRVSDPEGGIRSIVPRALAWLDSLEPTEPFFLFLNVLDVHAPYGPPSEFAGRFAGDQLDDPEHELPVAPGKIDVFGAIPGAAARAVAGTPLPARLRTAPIVARYDEDVLALDADVQRFVAELRRRGLLERSVFVFTADHGETMAASDYKFGHGVNVQAVLRVPLLIRLPDAEHAGTRIAARVQLLDLYPTLVELAGLSAPARALHGRSLVPLLAGGTLPEVPILHEGGLMEDTAVTFGELRLVETRPGRSSPAAIYSHARGRRLLEERYPGVGERVLDAERMREFFRGLGEPQAERRVLEALQGPFQDLYHLPSDEAQLFDLSAERPADLRAMLRHLREGEQRSRRERELVPPGTELTETGSAELEELRRLGYADGATHEED